MTDDDVPEVGRIWLEASLRAHDFVPADFWRADHEVMVTQLLPGAHGYVHVSDAGDTVDGASGNTAPIDGFVILGSGDRSDFMGALFVLPDRQGRGIGTRLLDHVKALRNPLRTSVYQQNERSVAFYLSRGFQIVGDSKCEETGCDEHLLRWHSER